MKLTEKNNNHDSLRDLQPHQYATFVVSSGELAGIHFRCPGCSEPIHIYNKLATHDQSWEIDFEKLTALPSIVHDKKKGGCGWHGYLTQGELIGKIE
jgi:hypothetical protein